MPGSIEPRARGDGKDSTHEGKQVSYVTNIFLIFHGDNSVAIDTINQHLASMDLPPLRDLSGFNLEGGNKHLETECWAGAYTRLQVTNFIKFVDEQDWDSDTILIAQEEDELFRMHILGDADVDVSFQQKGRGRPMIQLPREGGYRDG